MNAIKCTGPVQSMTEQQGDTIGRALLQGKASTDFAKLPNDHTSYIFVIWERHFVRCLDPLQFVGRFPDSNRGVGS
jgi:hypothetical protein